ncbi:AMIN domain-containing protein [bacterium]|nr:AMIN domain-containing protein [bacterium]
MKKIFIFLLIVSFSYTSLVFSETPSIKKDPVVPTSNYSFFFNDSKIELDSPPLLINEQLFIPLRDFSSHLNLDVNYQLKDDAYVINVPKSRLSALFIPNSTEVWVNQKKQYLNQAPLNYNQRLYIPLIDSFKSLAFNVERLSTQSYKLSVNPKQASLSKTPDSSEKLSPSLLRQIDNLQLPEFEDDRPLYISFGTSLHNIQSEFFNKNGMTYVNFAPILKKEKFKVTQTKDSISISKNNKTITWSIKNRTTKIKTRHSTENRPLIKPIKKGKTIFLPLQAVVIALDYNLHWDSRDRIITLLSHIKKIKVNDKKHPPTITITSSGPISPKPPKPSFWGNGYYIKIPYAISQLNQGNIPVNDRDLKTIELSNHNDEFSELFVGFNNSKLYPHISKKGLDTTITFLNMINKVEVFADTNKNIVDIYSSTPVKPKLWLSKNPSKLVIDYPKIVNHLPEIQRYNLQLIDRIRTSFSSKSSLRTRIVVDLKETISTYNISTTQDKTSITFFLNEEIVNKKRYITSRSKGKGLKNKVIVLDAGHGGRDPGGVGIHHEFEKTYALDITERLKKLLLNEGVYVVEARKGDTNPSLSDRVSIANKNKADALISIHINYFINKNTAGTETYYYKYKDKKLAQEIHKEMAKALKRPNRGVKRSKLYVLNHSNMPGALIEPLFITNPTELALLKKPSTRQKIAEATYRGIRNYFSK